MSKKLTSLSIIALASIFLAGCTKQSSTSQTTNETVSEATEFAKAIESGKPTTCVMTKDMDKMEYFIKGKKMYANMTTIIENKTILSHMINDEKYLYMWTDDQKQGSKINLLVSPAPAATSEPNNLSTPKFESEADYQNIKNEGYVINCKPSNIDETAFIPPSDVNFIDPTEMMQQLAPQGVDGQFDMSKLKELQHEYGEVEVDNP